MSEADLKNSLTELMREKLKSHVIFRHEDHRTSAIPDMSVTGYLKTSWLEVKFANPRLEDFELQHLRMQQLARVGFAWYVIYQTNTAGSQRTLIVEPRYLDEWQNRYVAWGVGFNHRVVVDFIRKVHTP